MNKYIECNICTQLKHKERYYFNKTANKISQPCKICTRERERIRRSTCPKTIRKRRDTHYKSTYGITIDDYDNMLEKQNGVCKICSRHCLSRNHLSVDHCHKTGNVRGLLCHTCNALLGQANEDKEILLDAIKYLKSYKDLPI